MSPRRMFCDDSATFGDMYIRHSSINQLKHLDYTMLDFDYRSITYWPRVYQAIPTVSKES
jgi:hypothetical protein